MEMLIWGVTVPSFQADLSVTRERGPRLGRTPGGRRVAACSRKSVHDSVACRGVALRQRAAVRVCVWPVWPCQACNTPRASMASSGR